MTAGKARDVAVVPMRDEAAMAVTVEAGRRAQILNLFWRLSHEDLSTNHMKYMKPDRNTVIKDDQAF